MSAHTLHLLQSGQLAGARELQLSGGLTQLPSALLDVADTLEVLDLSGNQLQALPDWLSRFTRLRVLFASNNPFTVLPEVLGSLPQLSMLGFKANQIAHVPAAALAPTLRWLILTDNALTDLPDAIGHCAPLEKLMLAGNRLRHLPDALAQCQNLALLRIAANRFAALPEWLLTLPRLSWLACAGNPLTAAAEAHALVQARAQAIAWSDLRVQGLLGEGASGLVHEAVWQQPGRAPRPVAFKRFKGSMTSDGLPHSELAASLAAGTHPHLIGAMGLVSGHPDGSEGLVMPRIEAHCTTLAGPPSRASCTRDVYAPDQAFTRDQALHIATGIAQAVAHLHERGLLHGDLYAHNILWHPRGEVLLGDFGAASFLPTDTRVAQALMKQEVRAMGCLLEELAQRTTAPNIPHRPDNDRTDLMALAQRCLHPQVDQRPTLRELLTDLCAM